MKKITTLLSLSLMTFFNALLWQGTTAHAADAPAAAAPAAVYTVQETAEFKTLTEATLAALAAGKKEEMVAKLTDLETAWDAKADVLTPKDATTWALLDKTLDKAISSLRSSKTDLTKGKAALEDLLKKLGQATKQPAKA